MLEGKIPLIANPAARHGEGAVDAVRAERLIREARLEFDGPLPVQIDGEPLHDTSYDISVEPGALRVIAPDGARFSQ